MHSSDIIPPPGQIEARREELRKLIEDGERAKAELAHLDDWISAGVKFFSTAAGIPPVNTSAFRKIEPRNPLRDSAEKVLRERGPLHMKDLINGMQTKGWLATGNYRRDLKNIHASLARSSKFARVGKSVWTLSENKLAKVKKG